jgi:hypothetical protein
MEDPKPESIHDKQSQEIPPESSNSEMPKPIQLTKEEQMALFEQDLKENDWGHRPC